jgi:hypothetical protein
MKTREFSRVFCFRQLGLLDDLRTFFVESSDELEMLNLRLAELLVA